jgi:hypothetical protein
LAALGLLALADPVSRSSRPDSDGPHFAKELSEEAQKAKQELEDALGRGILQRVPSGGKISGIAYQRGIKDELRGRVPRPREKEGRGPGF